LGRTFTFDQLSQPGGFGRFARGMTYLLVLVFFIVALVLALTALGWLVTGPIAASTYDSAPRCTSGFTDSCRGFASGRITRSSPSQGQTSFDVSVNGRDYTANLTENAAPELTVGEAVGVEIWQGAVVAITFPTGDRIITGSSPDWQKNNYALPIAFVVVTQILIFVGISQLRSARRGARMARDATRNPAPFPQALEAFDRPAVDEPRPVSIGDVTVRPTRAPIRLNRRAAMILVGAVAVLVLPILLAITAGVVPQSGRAAGSFYGAVTVLPLLAVLVVGLVIYRLLLMRNARLEVAGGELRSVDWAGRARVWPVSSISGFVLAPIRSNGSSNRWRRWLIIGSGDRVLVRFNAAFFAEDDVKRLASSLGARMAIETDQSVEVRRLNDRFPGAASWLEIHSGAAGALFVLVLMVAGGIAWLIIRTI